MEREKEKEKEKTDKQQPCLSTRLRTTRLGTPSPGHGQPRDAFSASAGQQSANWKPGLFLPRPMQPLSGPSAWQQGGDEPCKSTPSRPLCGHKKPQKQARPPSEKKEGPRLHGAPGGEQDYNAGLLPQALPHTSRKAGSSQGAGSLAAHCPPPRGCPAWQ